MSDRKFEFSHTTSYNFDDLQVNKTSVYRYKRIWDQVEIVSEVPIGQTDQMSNSNIKLNRKK